MHNRGFHALDFKFSHVVEQKALAFGTHASQTKSVLKMTIALRPSLETASSAALQKLRPLVGSAIQLFTEQLLRLDPVSRRDRFNGIISNDFVKRSAARYLANGTFVIGCLVDGWLRGTAELHPSEPSDCD